MEKKIELKLIQAINQLLNAGWNVGKVTEALSKQESFGKYDGCTPLVIKELALKICREENAKARVIEKELRHEINEAAKKYLLPFIKV